MMKKRQPSITLSNRGLYFINATPAVRSATVRAAVCIFSRGA